VGQYTKANDWRKETRIDDLSPFKPRQQKTIKSINRAIRSY